MRHFFIIIIYLLAIFSKASAQNQIQGKVLNMENAPIPQAVVTVIEKDSKRAVCTVLTDTLGMFLIPSCPPNVLLDVAAYGYEDYASEVSAPTYADKLLTIRMKYISLGEVVVTANAKPRMVRNGNKVIIDKLENSPHAKGNDLYSFMRFIPVLKVPTFEGNITLRETAGGSAVLLVNGKNIHIPMDAYLKNVRAEDVERIEVVANPMGEYRVGGNQGVINLIMKKREDEGAQYNLSLTDRQYGLNSQSGTFSISYTKKNLYITSGVYANNARMKSETESDYKFYSSDLQTLEKSNFKEKNLMFSGYFNIDYELNKKSSLGLQLGAGGIDIDNTFDTESQYKKLTTTTIDSIYSSQSGTQNPNKFSGFNTNLNYTLKVDDKGSMFYADIDYRLSRPQSNTHNLYNKRFATSDEIISRTDILQKNRTNINSYGTWLRYNHVFNPDFQWNSGVSFYAARSCYDYTYESREKDGNYMDDPNRSNIFNFNDYTFSAYTNLHYKWSKKLNMDIGIKIDTYGANGEQKDTGEEISRHEVNFIPTLTLSYLPSANHSFFLSGRCSAFQPSYYDLNPFRTYVSPTAYRKGNPDLKSNKMYSGSLTYNFFGDYSLTAYMMYVNNISADLTVSDENNQIMITPMNRGKMFYNAWLLSADKTFFNGYLNMSCELSYLFRKFKNEIPNMDAIQKKNIFGIDIDANITLSKRKRISAYITYGFMTEDMGTAYSNPNEQEINLSLNKRFAYSNLSVGIRKELQNSRRFYEQQNYAYNMWQKNYWYINVSYSVTFGNKRTRYVQNRGNDEMKGRIERTQQ